MISTLGTVPKPSFLTLIASISPYKPFQRHTRLWPPASQKSHYQTRSPKFASTPERASKYYSQHRRLFYGPEPQYRSRAVIFRYSSSSSNAGKEPNNNRDSLPSEDEGQRSNLSKKFSHLMDNVQSNIFFAGQRLNDLTGYSGIEALKRDIEEQGQLYFIYFIYSKIIYLTAFYQRGIFKLPVLCSSNPEKPTQPQYPNDPPLSEKSMSCFSANTHGPPVISSASQPSIALIIQMSRRNLWLKSG